MSRAPWLTIIGLGEDGLAGLPEASRDALSAAEIVMGPARHLGLLPDVAADQIEWPVPFVDGIDVLLAHRGRQVVVLASGDPFWFGAGSVLARQLAATEWRALPGQSCFALAANRLGWPLETTTCLALHAAPVTRLRPHLATGQRVIATLRDGAAVADVAVYLEAEGFGASHGTILEAMGGPRERVRKLDSGAVPDDVIHPVCIALDLVGGPALALASGLRDSWFEHDGQITKRPVRALTLSALAPQPGESLWDIGGGSGSVSIEWLLAHPSLTATTFEANPARAAQISANAARLGVDHLQVVQGRAPDVLQGQPLPDVIFVGGGLKARLLDWLTQNAPGCRLVANAVTLESEALLMQAQAAQGGTLLQVAVAQAEPLGRMRGWQPVRPIVQWSVTL